MPNLNDIIKQLTPHFLRSDGFIDYMYAAKKPLQDVSDDFDTFSNKTRYDLSFNGQKIYLEHILNDCFDSVLRRIIISNISDTLLDNYIYFDTEPQPAEILYFDTEGKPPLYVRFQSEYETLLDFVVLVPTALVYDTNELTAKVNKYRQAGKVWEIQTY